jgi:hypothetical protein
VRFVRMSRIVAGGAAALVMASGLLGVSAGPAAASAVKAGYAVVENPNLPAYFTSLPSGAAYNSYNAAAPAYVKHTGTGVYEVFFPGLQPGAGEQKGVAQAGSRDGSSYCSTDGVYANSDPGVPGVSVVVFCHSYLGNLLDTRFAVSYTNGAETGGLVTVKFAMEQYFPVFGPAFVPLQFHSTVGGSATVTANNFGSYTIDLPLLPGNEPATYQLTTEPGAPWNVEPPAANADRYPLRCGILSTSVVPSPSRQRLVVKCVDEDGQFDSASDWIYELNVTYARGINTIGKSIMATGYATVPLLTGPTSGLTVPGKNTIYGVSGPITVDRSGVGAYVVHFKNLSWGVTKPAAFATAMGSAAHCVAMTGAALGDEGTAFVYCRNTGMEYVDTSFTVQYLTRG